MFMFYRTNPRYPLQIGRCIGTITLLEKNQPLEANKCTDRKIFHKNIIPSHKNKNGTQYSVKARCEILIQSTRILSSVFKKKKKNKFLQ